MNGAIHYRSSPGRDLNLATLRLTALKPNSLQFVGALGANQIHLLFSALVRHLQRFITIRMTLGASSRNCSSRTLFRVAFAR
jgi:hypothetical protein